MNVMEKDVHAKELSKIAKKSIINCTETVRDSGMSDWDL